MAELTLANQHAIEIHNVPNNPTEKVTSEHITDLSTHKTTKQNILIVVLFVLLILLLTLVVLFIMAGGGV